MSARAARTIAVVAATFACAARPTAPPAATLAIPSAAPEGAAPPPAPSSSTEPRREALPAAIDLPPIACTLGGKYWRGPTLVRFRPGAPPFARVDGGRDAAVLLGANVAILDLDAARVRLRGAIEADQVPLRPARARLVAEVLVPLPYAALSWQGTKDGEVVASMPVDARVRGIDPRVAFSGPCTDFALEATFDPLDAVGGRGLDKDMLLRTKRAIAVAPDVARPAAIQLTVDDDDASVTVLARQGGKARIAWRGADHLVVGWVAASDLRPPAVQTGSLVGMGSGTGGVVSSGARRKCDREVLLVAEVAGERRTVGRIAPGVLIDVVDVVGREGFVGIALPTAAVHAAQGAALLVRKADVADCEAVATPVVGFGR